MINWVESKDQQFPDDVQQFENFKRNGNNEYLGVVKQMQRKKEILVTVPLSLGVHGKTGEYRWTICGSDEVTVPVRWALMPKPEGVDIEALFEVLKHGSDEHQAWLYKALKSYFNNQKQPDFQP